MTRCQTPRHTPSNARNQRALIADAAARLIAESGVKDYQLAKRKAANSLGLAENTQLPENAEVEAALRAHLRLFQDEEQIERIDHLRRKACELMGIMHRFNAYLTGPVLDGSAGRYAEIDIQLFTDSAKDVEIYLLNRNLDFEHSTPRSLRAEAVLTVHSDDSSDKDEIVANLIVYPVREERVSFKTRDGRTRQRARLDAVVRLIDGENSEQAAST